MSYRWWLLTSVSLFVLGMVFGIISYINAPAASFGAEASELQKLVDYLESLPRPVMMIAIFFKNLVAVAASVILSPIIFLVPLLTLLTNGWLIGLLILPVVNEHSVSYLLGGLLPHGIFELPALFMGEAMAFGFGATMMQAFFKGQTDDLTTGIKHDLRFTGPVVILFLIAAVIETYLTPVVLSLAI